ncbi:MAG TPA: Na+/H+ antiporter [Gemmatimonadales bacterium]|nr:Na+/H+ antiporter [Gemmatimonadales bacterium]
MPLSALELFIALAAVAVALDFLARKLATPRPVVLAAGGLLLGIALRGVPGLPALQVDPQTSLDIVLPPLLAVAAFRVPLGAFRASLRPITLLAVGLVLATMAGVAAVAHAIVPGVTWAAGWVLGAVVAPPDPVAATTVGRGLGLPNRLVTILEGEGLVNDAGALVTYQLAVAAVVTGVFSWQHAGLEVVRSVPVGVLTGLAVGWATAFIRRRVDDVMIETAVSLLLPYVAYLLAERLGGSAVLSVVAFGFFIRRRATEIGTPATRLVSRTVWQAIDFVTGGLVFILVGLELGRVVAAGLSGPLIAQAAVVSAAAIAIRLGWTYFVPHVVRMVTREPRESMLTMAELTVLGWSGMRGVVSLALALAIPMQTAAGEPFPARHALVTIALVVVLATLLGQGLTLAPLVRALGLADPDASKRQEHEARTAAVEAGRACIDRRAADRELAPDVHGRLVERLGQDVGLTAANGDGREAALPGGHEVVEVLLEALECERAAILRLRDDGRLNEESAASLEAELDLDELTLRGDAGQLAAQ